MQQRALLYASPTRKSGPAKLLIEYICRIGSLFTIWVVEPIEKKLLLHWRRALVTPKIAETSGKKAVKACKSASTQKENSSDKTSQQNKHEKVDSSYLICCCCCCNCSVASTAINSRKSREFLEREQSSGRAGGSTRKPLPRLSYPMVGPCCSLTVLLFDCTAQLKYSLAREESSQ